MYLSFYGLTELPFELAFNPKFFFRTTRHREVLNTLENGLLSARPVTVLLGDAGTGKTTLVRAARLSDRCRHVRFVYFRNAPRTTDEFVDTLRAKLELKGGAHSSIATLLDELHTSLDERHAKGQITALALDEAESLGDDLLEDLCLLATLQSASVPLLPIVLAGQSELRRRLDAPALQALRQWGSLHCELVPLDLSETAAYIGWRIQAAGSLPGRLFTREAVILVHELSKGMPRTINVICDNALLNGFNHQVSPVTRELVTEVCGHLDLGTATSRTGVPHREPSDDLSVAVHPLAKPGYSTQQ